MLGFHQTSRPHVCPGSLSRVSAKWHCDIRAGTENLTTAKSRKQILLYVGSVHLLEDLFNRFAELRGETLAYLVEVVA